MNPFDWAGPQFLAFYVVIAAGLLGWLLYTIRREDRPGEPFRFTDPYEIACLRDGPEELVRVATFALIGRGPLHFVGDELRLREDGPAVTHPLEQALIEAYRENPRDVERNEKLRVVANGYVDRLIAQGALLSRKLARQVQVVRGIVLMLVLGVGLTKLILAASRGRTNTRYLVLAMITALLIGLYRRHRRTARGQEFLQHMQTMLSASQVSTRQELLMVAAVWGATGLSELSRRAIGKGIPEWKVTWVEKWMYFRGRMLGHTYGCGHGSGGSGKGCGGCSSS